MLRELKNSRREFLRTASLAAGGMLIINRSLLAQAPSSLVIRKEIRSLDDTELEKLRNAFNEIQRKGIGVDGYQYLAGHHGMPRWLCHNDHSIFLPWHRAYIFAMEQALRRIDSTVSLPYWDWTSAESIANGIPEPIAVEEYDVGGQMVPNPLHSARVDVDGGRSTARSPQDPMELMYLAMEVDNTFTETSYSGFNSAIDGPHGSLHGWVGGDMRSVRFAAFDPIFWMHHANVDRQWAQWQLGVNNQDPLPEIRDKLLVLGAFDTIFDRTIDYRRDLNYDYDNIAPMPPAPPLMELAKAAAMEVKPIPADRMTRRIVLYVHGLRASEQSFNIAVFINRPDANAKTPIKGNPNFAGFFGIFGLGRNTRGMHGKRNARVVDITDAVKRIAKGGDFEIKLVATDAEGKQVDVSKLPFDSISIKAE